MNLNFYKVYKIYYKPILLQSLEVSYVDTDMSYDVTRRVD